MADKTSTIETYLNSLNEAMAIHAKKAIEGLEFDRTELAEIVDITNRDKGEYQVYNGSQRYYAYSENTSYTLKTKVYVTIPNNDYTQQKLIKGKYKSGDSDTTINWVSPLESYQPLTETNLIEDSSIKDTSTPYTTDAIKVNNELLAIEVLQDYDNASGTCLLANYNSQAPAASAETDQGATYAPEYKVLYKTTWLQEDSVYNQNYKYMGISAKFKTGLSGFHPIAGSYGLLFLIDYEIKLSGEDERVRKLKVCKLDSPSMIGNVYNFDTFYKQEALFELDNNPENGFLIKRIAVVFYQDGEFRDSQNELISPYLDDDTKQLLPVKNICVKDIEIYFGNEIKEEVEDQAKIYTLNGLMYDSAQTNEKLNEKRIHLEWLHRNPEPEMQDDGTLKYVKELMGKSDLRDVPSDADVKLIANIHWYTDASYTTDAMRADIADQANHADKLWEVTEKWKYAPNSLTSEDVDVLVNETNWTPKKDYTYLWNDDAPIYDVNGNPVYKKDGEGNIILDENEQPIQETGGRYVLTVTASGEQTLNRAITRNSKEDTALSVSDELAGPGWVPIPGTGLDSFEIVYQPDVKRGECSVKCIIEYGPELLIENETTGELEKTGRVDPNSMYYTIVVAMDSYEENAEDHITFKNLSWVPDLATHDVATGLTITVDDKTEGHYPIYNATDGRILARNEIERLRTLTADMLSQYTGNSLLSGNEVILWQIPKSNTMININGTLSSDKSEVVTAKNFNSIFNNENLSKIENKITALGLILTSEEFNDLKEYILDKAVVYSTITKWYNKALLDYKKATDKYNSSENPEEDIIEYNSAKEEYEGKKVEYETALQNLRDDMRAEALDYFTEHNLEHSDEDVDELAYNLFKIMMEVSPSDHDLSKWFNIEAMDFDNYYYLIRFGTDVSPVNNYQGFYINEYYSTSATTNTIFCYLVKNNQIYKGEITLTFSQHGTSGTDYTFAFGLGELVQLPEGLEVINGEAVDYSEDEWEVIGPAAPALTIGAVDAYGNKAFRRVKFDLYNSKNELIELTDEQKNVIIEKWVARSGSGFYCGATNAENLEFLIKAKRHENDGGQESGGQVFVDFAMRAPDGDVDDYRYIIMSASVRSSATSKYHDDEYNVGDVNFVQMLPVHIRADDKYILEGADYITYDDKGANPQAYSDEFDLLNVDDEDICVVVNGVDVQTSLTTYKYYPHLDQNNKLQPCPIYVSSLDKTVAIEASVYNEELGYDEILYSMPLLIIQNRYEIPAINSWNGQLLIDEDNNRVMAATIAAGHKNQQNQFTGVIMGDIERISDVSGSKRVTTGLLGYKDGAESFGWMSDGTGFIGKAGKGQILLNGDKSTIQSASYTATKTVAETLQNGSDIYDVRFDQEQVDPANLQGVREGTLIDLDDGYIDMWGNGGYTYARAYNPSTQKVDWTVTKNQNDDGLSTNIHLDTRGNPYFRIGVPVESNSGNIDSDGLKSLIRVDKSNYYLQTADYKQRQEVTNNNVTTVIPGSGLKIDLKRGVFDSQGQLTINGALGSEIKFGEDTTNYLKLGINNSGGSYLDMVTAGNGTSDQISDAANELRSLADDLNAYFWYDDLVETIDPSTETITNAQWQHANPSESVFKNPENVEWYTADGRSSWVVFPKDRNLVDGSNNELAETDPLYYYNVLTTKLNNSVMPDQVGIKSENKTATDYLAEGATTHQVRIIKDNEEYIFKQDGETLKNPETYLFYKEVESPVNIYETDERGQYILDSETGNRRVKEVAAYRTLYEPINYNNIGTYYDESEKYTDTETGEEFVIAYIKGYELWKEPIEEWREWITYNTSEKVYVRDASTGDLSFYFSKIAKNRHNNPPVSSSSWQLTTQNRLITDAEEKQKMDLYTEAFEKTGTDVYRRVQNAYDNAVRQQQEYYEALQVVEQDYNEAVQQYNNAIDELTNSLDQLLNTSLPRYEDIIAEDRFPDMFFENSAPIEIDTPEETNYKYLEQYLNIKNNRDTYHLGELNYIELWKAQQDAEKDIVNKQAIEEETWKVFYNKDQNSWVFNSNGFSNVQKLKDEEANYTKLYNAYSNLLSQRQSLEEEKILNSYHFLKDENSNDIDENNLPSDFDLRDYINNLGYFDNYKNYIYNSNYTISEDSYYDTWIKTKTLGELYVLYHFIFYSTWSQPDNSSKNIHQDLANIDDTISNLTQMISAAVAESETLYVEFGRWWNNAFLYNRSRDRLQAEYEEIKEALDNEDSDAIDELITKYHYSNATELSSKCAAYKDYDDVMLEIISLRAELSTAQTQRKAYLTNSSEFYIKIPHNGTIWHWDNPRTGEQNELRPDNLSISAPRNLIIEDYNKIKTLVQTIDAQLEDLNHSVVHFDTTETSDGQARDIKVIEFEEPCELEINNTYREFGLYSKYNDWQEDDTNTLNIINNNLSISIDLNMLSEEKSNLETSLFYQLSAQEAQAQFNDIALRYDLYKKYTLTDTYNDQRLNLDTYIRLTANEAISGYKAGTDYYRLVKAEDFIELQETISNYDKQITNNEPYYSANNGNLKYQYDIIVENYNNAVENTEKARKNLEKYSVNFIPVNLADGYNINEVYFLNNTDLSPIPTEDLINHVNELVYQYLDIGVLSQQLINIINDKIVNYNYNTTFEKYIKKIDDYKYYYEKFIYYNQGNLNGIVKLNNNKKIRLQLGSNFSVNDEGYLKATAGEMENITINKLNFRGYTDSKGVWHSGATNIVPKRMRFVTAVSLSGTKENLSVSASIHKEITVSENHTFYYPQYELATGSFGVSSSAPLVISNHTNMVYYQSHVGWQGGQSFSVVAYPSNDKVWTGKYTQQTKQEWVTIPYEDTWTAWTNVPAITSVTLTYNYVNMWALTNEDEQQNVSGGTVTNKV